MLGEVKRALANTVPIAVISVVLAFVIALGLGILAATRIGGIVDRLATGIAVLGISVPQFWLAVILVIIFAVELGWLPAEGMGPSGSDNFSFFRWSELKFAIMPIVALTLLPLGILMRTTRASIAEVLALDFIQTLRAKGLGRTAIVCACRP